MTSTHDPKYPSTEALLEQSAKRGARLALKELGLDDAHAPKDLNDLRQLLTSWRRVRHEAARIMVRVMVQLTLLAMVALATIVLWASGR